MDRIVVRSRIEKISRHYPSMDFSDSCKGGRLYIIIGSIYRLYTKYTLPSKGSIH